MSDEGERTCPLCAEEMDLTDQQLKPCRCGYEICVWCWHHIMDMAEKDDTEGRCPACRNPYNKEKIVGTAASCERLVTEMNMEKKGKSQKGKTKIFEGRKQLTSVRVIQKNLVYIVGLPLNLADEDLLQRREYFSLYGKVQKVSISRTAAGTIQQFPNNTCSVYITYLKEEEAVRCIQAVNGYTLEGRLLRACFGTTKYCHAWIRNVPCNNPDCLYLHEVGSQEDSFSKDEIISGYSRSRPQQVPSITNTMQQQRRSGNMLPPPADDYCNNSHASSCKSVSKSTPNTSSSLKISPPNSSSGRSTALPAGASWGSRAFSNPQPPACVSSLNGSHKPDTGSGPVSFSTALTSSNHVPTLPSGIGKKLVPSEENKMGKVEYRSMSEPAKQILPAEHPSSLSENPSKSANHSLTIMSSKLYSLPGSKDKNKHASFPPTDTNSDDTSSESSSPSSVKDANDDVDEPVRRLSSDVLAMNIGNQQPIELGSREQCREPLTSQPLKPVESNSEIYNSCTKPSTGWDMETPVPVVQVSQLEENDELLSFDSQRLKDPEVFSGGSYFSNLSPLRGSNGHGDYTHLINGPFAVKGDPQFADNKVDSVSQFSGTPFLSSGYPENHFNSSSLSNNTGQSNLSSNRVSSKHVVGMYNGPVNDGRNPALDMGESSIISNILSLDYDPWNESLNSPQNLAKYLGETDRNHGSQPSPWRAPQSNQSRFSFAREEEPYTRAPEVESFREQAYQQPYYGRDFANKASFHGDNSGTRNGFPFLNNEESDMYSSSHSLFSSSKLTGARSQIAAPPGFATPNRAPPGFLSHERVEQTFNSFSGHNTLDASSFRNQYQSTQAGNNYSNGDIEFMDPAILAVGKGRLQDGLNNNSGLDMRSSYSPQMNNFDNDARIQMLMRRSLSSHQNQRYNDVGDAFSSLADSIRNPSRVMEQSLSNNMPPFSQMNHMSQSRNPLMSNGHWDSWNEVQSGNNLGVTELLRPERFTYNKYYTGYEDSKLHMPSQSDIYNRTYGI